MFISNILFLRGRWVIALAAVTCAGAASPMFAGSNLNLPVIEEFAAGPRDWRDSSGAALLQWLNTGGPDAPPDPFAASTFNFSSSAPNSSVVLFRAHDEYGASGASGGEFIGDWISSGVTEFSARVRHETGVPVNFFVRFASPSNFPGGTGVVFVPVPSGAWTEIDVGIFSGNPQFVTFEGSNFNTVFDNIGHVQIGVNVPASLAGVNQAFRFDLDNVTAVPEPGTVWLLLGGVAGMVVRRRRIRTSWTKGI